MSRFSAKADNWIPDAELVYEGGGLVGHDTHICCCECHSTDVGGES